MKKICKILIVILCLCPLLLFAACKSQGSYLISAKPSDSQLGSITGVLTEEMKEGTKITLVAKENKPSTNPFICWVKDYRQVVSLSNNLVLTYSAQSAGNYTAIYEEDNPESMLYACLSNVELISDVYTSVTYELEYANLDSGSNDFSTFTSGNFTVGSEYKTDCRSVLRLRNEKDNEYKFNIKLRLATGPNSETSYEVQIKDIVTRKSFNNEGKCEINQKITILSNTIDLTLTFQKLSKELY